jgi:CheY-like chemotaxis protein
MRAIIVEGEFLAAIHAETALERLGIEVVGTAEDSAGALALADQMPRLALVDLNLRDGFTGPGVGSKLARKGIGVVFVTANPQQLDGWNDMRSPVLEKPLEEPKLAQVVEQLMTRGQR